MGAFILIGDMIDEVMSAILKMLGKATCIRFSCNSGFIVRVCLPFCQRHLDIDDFDARSTLSRPAAFKTRWNDGVARQQPIKPFAFYEMVR